MCGISGYWAPQAGRSAQELAAIARGMAATLAHRGPDDEGAWEDAAAGLALGHRRLSVIDLSMDGHQPMVSASGRYVLTYNGEVYNFPALRADLEGHGAGFRGHCDTEVMLAAFDRWGIRGAVERFNGMFAFAVWDRDARELHLLRDRMGEKPLYYGWAGRALAFASELKALMAVPGYDPGIDRAALADFFRVGYVPAPRTIFAGTAKLPPGGHLTVRPGDVEARALAEPARYWSPVTAALEGAVRPEPTDPQALEAELEALLRDAVGLRTVADVPLGAFLSGGVDSSAVVALMQAQSARPVRTFTIGFEAFGYDEAAHARAVARHLGTDHTELYVTPAEAQAVIPRLPELYDEPFADPSQIPTYLVSRLARRQVTVCLSGDGGDELFGGYNRYFWGQALWSRWGRWPRGLRHALARALRAAPPGLWTALLRAAAVVRRGEPISAPGDKLLKLARLLEAAGPEAVYGALASHWAPGEGPVLGAAGAAGAPPDIAETGGALELRERMMLLDMLGYLPDDILAKLDRASMAVSLESRVPLLDPRLVEFSWRVPPEAKFRGGQGKWLLRQVLYRYVPRELIERPKMGFGVPIDAWLRGPLRDWAEDLLGAERLRHDGLLDPAPIRQKWHEHLSGRRNWQPLLWDVLMFQAWHEHYRGTPHPVLGE